MQHTQRRQRLSQRLSETDIANFLITDLENIFYLTGFKGTNAYLWHKQRGRHLLITDPRYSGQAKALCETEKIDCFIYEPDNLDQLAKAFPKKFSTEDSLTFRALEQIKKKAPHVAFTMEHDIVETLRQEKDLEEITIIRKAQHFVDHLLQTELPKMITEGLSEKSLAFKLEQALRHEGHHDLSFPSIVAFGENSAIPHHQNSERTLKEGDNILIDCGIILDGYCSDITRNFNLGTPSIKYANAHELLLKAQQKSLQQVKSGESVSTLDQICRSHLGDQETYFTHSLGHGVGINVHEAPRISSKSDEILQENMIITIEPGLYYEGRFGIRIEDLVWVQKDGYEILSQCPRDLVVIK